MLLVRVVRQSQSLTQGELAEKTGIHPSDISRIEKGRINPSMDKACKIADALCWIGNPLYLFLEVGKPL